MKKIIFFVTIAIFLASCGADKKPKNLQELRQQQSEFKEKLAEVEQQIAAMTDSQPAKNRITQVKIQDVQPIPFTHYLNTQGEVTTDNNITIPNQMSGLVEAVLVDKGDRVKKGQVLAKLDADIIEKQMAELKTGLELATTVYERRKRLWGKKIGSEIEYLQAKNNKESLERKLETIQEQLSMYQITSPINGTVDEIFLKEGEIAVAGMGAIRVIQLKDMKIVSEVSEKYLYQIRKGDEVKITSPYAANPVTATVLSVETAIDPENRTFTVEVAIPAGLETTPHMILDLAIRDYHNPQALTVPVNIIQKTSEQSFLFVAEKTNNGWKASKKWITTGKIYKNTAEILKGIKAGDKIITSGYQNLADGVSISF
jgi:RND family efflux transporter MFP subunit